MTAPIYAAGSAGTASDGYRCDPPPVPRPRESQDHAEPGHRVTRTDNPKEQQQR